MTLKIFFITFYNITLNVNIEFLKIGTPELIASTKHA